ncbi:hypothetical protein [Spirosoma sp.]|uniref:amidohydrolase family protein n=1 Tax=Spirosoma sp. TaxID=1899569 RepID=UPI00262DFF86|nr:hypothetical protein [Spirosoma sp.]MCX6212852.1 hypothetical protein [Spirosoma sp.]
MKKIIITVTLLVGLTASYFLLLRPHSSLPEHLLSKLPAKYGRIAASKSSSYLITDVSVIPMSRDTILAHQNVLIKRGHIHQITPLLDRIDTSTHPVRINGQGQYLIPGLNDMHVYINDENNLLLFVANGVTTVRNMAGAPFDLILRQQSRDGQILSPTLYTASPILEGSDNVWKFSVVLKNKQEARQAVLTYKQAGYDFIKVYHTLPADVYREILRVSDSLAVPVVGHIPFQLDLPQTLALSQYSLEHVDLRPISPQIPLFKKLAMVGQSKK